MSKHLVDLPFPDKRFFLAQDNDCHWYVIPEENRKDWERWVDLDQEDEDSWTVPPFAIRVNGSASRVTFTNYQLR